MTPSVNSIPERVWSALGRGCARLLLLAWLLPAVSAADSNYTEAEVKAAALSRIVDYVKWPAGTFADAKSPIVIGVIGRNLFEGELSQVLKSANTNGIGRPVIVRQYKDGETVANCQILFVAASEKSRVAQILQKIEHTGILTISDMEGFVTRLGGGLRLFIDKSLQVEVNQNTVEREKIIIDPEFLGMRKTRIIRDGKVVK